MNAADQQIIRSVLANGPHTILIVPPTGDFALLANGPCGERPAQLEGLSCGDASHGLWWTHNIPNNTPICAVCLARKRWTDTRGLVLLHAGTVALAGCDRFARWWRTRHPLGGVGPVVAHAYDAEMAAIFATFGAREGGRAVYLDSDGWEIA